MTATMTDLGVGSTARDLISVETYGGHAAVTAEGRDLLALVQISTHTRSDGGYYALHDHGAARSYRSLDIAWSLPGRGRPFPAEGRERDALLQAATSVIGAPSWVGLVELWTRWSGTHLAPGCIHQVDDPTASVRSLLRRNRPCQVDGWVFGSGWLRRPITSDVEHRARQIGIALERGR